ncbi:hypothetical protein T484DRAFT_1781864 [Baffinella frigidus]|nr:hypothetical protein T484DRAFT_1781864 [Cryptophyta sp. CCMP2293]
MPEEEAEAGGGDVVLEGGEDVVIDVAPPDSAAKAAAERKSTGGFDWGDEMEEEEKKDDERFVEIEAKIAVQNEKARARAERFSVEFVEPKLEVILTREEVGIFRAVTKAREPKPEKDESAPQAQRERRGRGRATHTDIMGITAGDEIKGEVRDREYTEALLAKVAELHRGAKARAEKFGEEYAPPRLKVLLTPTEFRKYMSATAGRNPLDLEYAPVAGIDTTTEEEKEMQRKRASRFAPAEGAEGAEGGGVEAMEDPAVDEEEQRERIRAELAQYTPLARAA